MNNIDIGKETIRITKDKKYYINSKEIHLPDLDFEKVIVISPDEGKEMIDHCYSEYKNESMCRIKIINSDSIQAGRKFEKEVTCPES